MHENELTVSTDCKYRRVQAEIERLTDIKADCGHTDENPGRLTSEVDLCQINYE